MNSTAVIFGGRGGIGSASVELLSAQGYDVVAINSDQLNFTNQQSYSDVATILNQIQPGVIVNAVGVFVQGHTDTHHNTMDINFGSNWAILSYYMQTPPSDASVKIIMIGSSSYHGGRKKYPLYSASKAALHNLWQSSVEYFVNLPVTVDLINPARTRTKMVAIDGQYDSSLDYIEPSQVAQEIISLIKNNSQGKCIDMNFKDMT
jgi:short-subunit dehydrogenase